MIESHPFVIRGFHTDNGSEYLNWATDRLLKRLQIDFTRSRARRSNDTTASSRKTAPRSAPRWATPTSRGSSTPIDLLPAETLVRRLWAGDTC